MEETKNADSASLLGIKFAPLKIPWERRLQTLCIFHFWSIFMLGGTTSVILILYLLLSRYFLIVAAILAWIYIDRSTPRTGGRRSNWFRHLKIWKHTANYFPAKLHKTVDLDPSRKYLCGYHPHGIMSYGCFIHFGSEGSGFSEMFPGVTPYLCTLDGWFNFPILRDYLMLGGLVSVNRESVDWILSQPGSLCSIVLGGAAESLEAHPDAHAIILQRRKGFIKKAIVHGADLLPTYSFGELDVYDQIANAPGSRLRSIQMKLTNWFGFAPPLYHGRGMFNYSMGFLPFRKPINTVVGKPITTTQNNSPTNEEIEKLHTQYVEALKELFEENKTKYGVDKDKHLTVL